MSMASMVLVSNLIGNLHIISPIDTKQKFISFNISIFKGIVHEIF